MVCAVLEKDGKILIAKRLKGKQAGFWEFPGGKVEPHESREEAIQREMMEEMEVEIEIREYLFCVIHFYDEVKMRLDCYLCELKSEAIHLNDHSDYRWIDPYEEVEGLLTADRKVVEKYRKYLERQNVQ